MALESWILLWMKWWQRKLFKKISYQNLISFTMRPISNQFYCFILASSFEIWTSFTFKKCNLLCLNCKNTNIIIVLLFSHLCHLQHAIKLRNIFHLLHCFDTGFILILQIIHLYYSVFMRMYKRKQIKESSIFITKFNPWINKGAFKLNEIFNCNKSLYVGNNEHWFEESNFHFLNVFICTIKLHNNINKMNTFILAILSRLL